MASGFAYQTIARFYDCQHAYIIKGRLETEGIPVFIIYQHHGVVGWVYTFALDGVRLAAPNAYSAEANRVCEDIDNGEYERLMRDVSFYDIAHPNEKYSKEITAPVCPKCDSSDQQYLNEGRLVLFLCSILD